VELAAALIWYSDPSTGESEPRVPRKEEENLIPACLTDCASYLKSLLHATTLVRSTLPQFAHCSPIAHPAHPAHPLLRYHPSLLLISQSCPLLTDLPVVSFLSTLDDGGRMQAPGARTGHPPHNAGEGIQTRINTCYDIKARAKDLPLWNTQPP
jgi:hypothetical protein